MNVRELPSRHWPAGNSWVPIRSRNPRFHSKGNLEAWPRRGPGRALSFEPSMDESLTEVPASAPRLVWGKDHPGELAASWSSAHVQQVESRRVPDRFL